MSPGAASTPAGGGPHYRFFGGKGGVGKTTCAAAWALSRARAGRRVLAVSTDPAHSLGDALGTPLGPEPRTLQLAGAGGGELRAVELAAAPAYRRWLDRHRAAFTRIAEEGTYLDRDDVDRLLALPMPGADELLALLEVVRLVRDAGAGEVVVDTAPTAHTLRLLASPETLRRFARLLAAMQEKRRAVAETLAGAWRADDTDAAVEALEADAAEAAGLVRDEERARLTWVLLPEELSVEETLDALAELAEEGVPVADVIVNRLTPEPDEPCGECEPRRAAEARAVRRLAEARPDLRLVGVPEVFGRTEERRQISEGETVEGGAASREPHLPVSPPLADLFATAGDEGDLEAVAAALEAGSSPLGLIAAPGEGIGVEPPEVDAAEPLPEWPAFLAPPGLELLLFGGKGGVGKSTCAAAAALLLARLQPERRILLLSTDPAHSLADVWAAPLGDEARAVPGAPPNLAVRELDAAAAFARVRRRLRGDLSELFGALGDRGGWQASADRRVVESFLDTPPPGLDELVAVATLAERGADGYDLVIVDTAPTGHALRLLEMPRVALDWDHALMSILLKYRRTLGLGNAAEELLRLAGDLHALDERLRDPRRCRFVAVTRAARLPQRETLRLVESLRAMEIDVPAAVVNALTAGGCARCRRRAAAEARWTAELECGLAAAGLGGEAILRAPARHPPPRGAAALAAWGRRWRRGARGDETEPQ